VSPTIRVASISAPREVRIDDVALAEPGDREVRVRVHGCGICGSNIPVWEGRPWFSYPQAPGAPGHEAWGTVELVGQHVTGVRAGDPVALLTSQAFADAVVVPATEVVVLPDALRGVAFPGEALGAGFNVARRSHFEADEVVAVIGIGFLGAIVTRLAAAAGARVIAISRRPASLELARSMGAADVVAMDDHQRIIDEVVALTAGALCRTVVEAVGAQWPLDLAGQLTAFGGRLVVAGYHQDGARQVDMQLWNWRGIDVINAHERDPEVVRHGVRDAAAAVVDGWFDPAPMYTHTFALAQLGRAMDAIVERPAGFVKSLVTM
jgi:threonine dehydrogenase-like Zn-dependent dehydrogenase